MIATGHRLLNLFYADKPSFFKKINKLAIPISAVIVSGLTGLYLLIKDFDIKDIFNFDIDVDPSDLKEVLTAPTTSGTPSIDPMGTSIQDVSPKVSKESQKPTIESTSVSKGSSIKSSLAAPSDEIRKIIKDNSGGVDSKTLYAIAGSESSFRSKIGASTSSATGLFQFTAPTWNGLLADYPSLGYTLEDRSDPKKSTIMASLYIGRLQKSLFKYLGRQPNLRETYLAYFLGATGATKLLSAFSNDPNTIAETVLPNAARSNPSVFYDKTTPRTVSQVLDIQGSKVEKYAVAASEETTSVVAQSPNITYQTPKMPALPETPVKVVAEIPSPQLVSQNAQTTSSSSSGTQEKSLVKDPNGRLYSIRS